MVWVQSSCISVLEWANIIDVLLIIGQQCTVKWQAAKSQMQEILMISAPVSQLRNKLCQPYLGKKVKNTQS